MGIFMALAIILHSVLVRGNKNLGKQIVWPWVHLFCWLIPLGINIAALSPDKLGNSGD